MDAVRVGHKSIESVRRTMYLTWTGLDLPTQVL